MSMNRIQKLLSSEYCDFEDAVLLESPFVETTREGIGIRQIQLGVTPTKLILAKDFLSWNFQEGTSQERERISLDNFAVSPELDPDIETLELVSVIPIECVNLSIFHRRKKCTLKARLCNGRVLYLELGGSRNRKMLWNLWRERVKFLSPEEDGSSVSEVSAASSSSRSTLYLTRRRAGVARTGKTQIWNVYGKQPEDATLRKSLNGAGDFHESPLIRRRWTDRNLFSTDLSDVYDEPEPEKLSFKECDFIMEERSCKNVMLDEVKENDSVYSDNDDIRFKWSLSKEVEINPINNRHEDSFEIMIPIDDSEGKRESSTSHLVKRFGSDVQENCGIGLYLFPLKSSSWELKDKDPNFHLSRKDFVDLMDAGVNIWEKGICASRKSKPRHLRRYGLSPCPQLFHGLGPFWEYLTKGEKCSVQLRHTASAVELHRAPSLPEFDLPLPKNQLSATISCDFLTLPIEMSNERQKCEKKMSKYPYTPLPSTPIFFWTTDLSYWPRSSRVIYHKQRKILKGFIDCMNGKIEEMNYKMHQKNLASGNAYEKRYSLSIQSNLKDGMINKTEMERKNNKGGRKRRRLKNSEVGLMDYDSMLGKSSPAHCKRKLRLHIRLTAWDFDSRTIAYQLTIIDRDLFLQIPVSELGILVNCKSYIIERCFLYPLTSWHKGTPCIAAFITFSHRISCLISSEILKGESVKVRARLVARFINAANKCYQMQNFQSCHSIICGLQSPAIYRLQQTWHHLRHRHANKYELFEHLCKFYNNTRLREHDDFSKYSKRMPFIPCINFLIVYILDGIANEKFDATSTNRKTLTKKYDQYIRTRKHNLNDTKEMDDLKESFNSVNKLGEGSVPSNCKSRLLQRFLSAFRNWPSISHQRHKFPGQAHDRTLTAAPKVINNDWSSWIEKAAPELKTYFTAVSEEDCRIKDSNYDKYCSPKNEESHSNQVFYDYRMKLFEKAAEMLLSSQCLASNYAMVQNDLAREYLLKARYKEHNENYELSFKVENTRFSQKDHIDIL